MVTRGVTIHGGARYHHGGAVGPVVAIAEAAMRTATFLGRGFSVVTTLGRTAGRAWDLAAQYGVKDFCRNVRACEIPGAGSRNPRLRRACGDHRGMCQGRRGRLRCDRSPMPQAWRTWPPTSAGASAYQWWTGLPPRPARCNRWCPWDCAPVRVQNSLGRSPSRWTGCSRGSASARQR